MEWNHSAVLSLGIQGGVSTVLVSATKRQHKATRFLVGGCTLGSVLRVLVFHDIPEGLAR